MPAGDASGMTDGPARPVPPVEPAAGDDAPASPFVHRRNVEGRGVLVRWAEHASYACAWAAVVVALVASACLMACILLQVVYRYILNAPLSWTDEMAIFLFVWSMLLFATVCVRDRSHVRFTALVGALPSAAARVLDRVIMVIAAGFGLVLVYISPDMLSLVWGNRSPAINYPLQLLYVIVPVHGMLLVVHAATNLFVLPEHNEAAE